MRATAVERVHRILSIMPWIVANPGCSIEQVCTRFDIDEKSLRDDLDTVQFVGLPPFTPDMLIEVYYGGDNEDLISLNLGHYFTRPPRLSGSESLTLLTAAKLALGLGGPGDALGNANDILRSAVTKLETSLGLDSTGGIEVEIPDVDTALVARIRSSLANRHRTRISYYSYGRDQLTERTVEPLQLTNHHGHWYLRAHCCEADDDREFRLDRIYSSAETDEEFTPRDDTTQAAWEFSPHGRTVTITGPRSIEWVAQTYPVDSVDPDGDGGLRITLTATEDHWLERLMLRLPTDAVVSDSGSGNDLTAMRAAAARRILDRYGVS